MEEIKNIASYFLSKDTMTHKKLQKLCYYAQAWYLANYGQALVPNRFEAWIHGPVAPDLYSYYREWGWEYIPKFDAKIEFNNKSVPEFLDTVFDSYGGYDADQLEEISHKESPWNIARGNCSPDAYSRNPIALDDMKKYYGERIGKKW